MKAQEKKDKVPFHTIYPNAEPQVCKDRYVFEFHSNL